MCVFECLREQERANPDAQMDRWMAKKRSVVKTEKAAGYIHPHPLNRGSTWIGRIVEESESAGVARALLCVHQFKIIPAAAAEVSLSHILNPFLFGDTPDCCRTQHYSEFLPVTHKKFYFLLSKGTNMDPTLQNPPSTLTPTPRWIR